MIVLDLSLLFDNVLVCLPFCWCPCMAINVSVRSPPVAQRYHVTSDTWGREFDPGKRDFSH